MTDYTLIRSPRTTIQISILPDKTVEVRAPLFAPQKKIDEFVSSHERWIQKRLVSSTPIVTIPVHHAYVAGERILYLGKPYTLRIINKSESLSKEQVYIDGKYVYVCIKDNLDSEKKVHFVQRAIELWQRQQAYEVFGEMLEKCWQKFSIQYPKTKKPELYLRTMKTRWGSLSQPRTFKTTAHMTLNTLLICSEPYCIEQVVYHELCHLIHADHSKSFYETLELFVPDWKETKKLLESTFK